MIGVGRSGEFCQINNRVKTLGPPKVKNSPAAHKSSSNELLTQFLHLLLDFHTYFNFCTYFFGTFINLRKYVLLKIEFLKLQRVHYMSRTQGISNKMSTQFLHF